MRYLFLALVLSLAACAHTPQVNQAAYHASTLTKAKPACIPMPDVPDAPDAALCAVGGKVLLWCWSGTAAGSDCQVLANFFPQEKKEQPQQQQGAQGGQPGNLPVPTPTPTITPVATATSSPAPAAATPAEKPKADPAKKPDAKAGGK